MCIEDPEDRVSVWYINLLNEFGENEGFKKFMQRLDGTIGDLPRLSLEDISLMMKILHAAKVCQDGIVQLLLGYMGFTVML